MSIVSTYNIHTTCCCQLGTNYINLEQKLLIYDDYYYCWKKFIVFQKLWECGLTYKFVQYNLQKQRYMLWNTFGYVILYLEAAFFKKGVLTTFWPIIIFFLFQSNLDQICQKVLRTPFLKTLPLVCTTYVLLLQLNSYWAVPLILLGPKSWQTAFIRPFLTSVLGEAWIQKVDARLMVHF